MSAAIANINVTYAELLEENLALRAKLDAFERGAAHLRQMVKRSKERSLLVQQHAAVMEDEQIERYKAERDDARRRAVESAPEVLALKNLLDTQRLGHALMLASMEASR